MSEEMDRVVIPNHTDLEREFMGIPHSVTVIRSKEEVYYSDNGNVQSEQVNGNIQLVKCKNCNADLDDPRDAERHADNGHIDSTEKMSEQLSGVGIHGFNFNGYAGHGTSLRFSHQDLALEVLVSPGEWHGESQTVIIGVMGGCDTEFERFNGQTQKRVDADMGLTYRDLIEEIRDFIENRFTDIDTGDGE